MADEKNVLDHVEGQWQKLLTIVLHKLVGEGISVFVFPSDIKAMSNAFKDRGGPVLVTHGHANCIEYKVLSAIDAEMLVMKQTDRNIKRKDV